MRADGVHVFVAAQQILLSNNLDSFRSMILFWESNLNSEHYKHFWNAFVLILCWCQKKGTTSAVDLVVFVLMSMHCRNGITFLLFGVCVKLKGNHFFSGCFCFV